MKKQVSFKNRQIIMAGELYCPEGFDERIKYPAVVVTHPAGAVKEQSPAVYAQKLSQYGIIILTFDASHQGASGGEPRLLENPTERVEDIRSAVDYLTTLPFIDRKRIGALGICAGAGYSISAAQTERRIKAVAGVSTTDAGAAIREGWTGGAPVSEQIKLLEAVADQRTAEANGAPVKYGPYVPDEITDDLSVTMREAHEYYRTPRAQHPNSQNRVMFNSLDKIIAFSAFDRIDTLLTQPLLLIAGSNADSLYFSEHAYEKAATCEKELFIIQGATHVALYDVPEYVGQAVLKLAEFFGKNL